MTHDQRTFGNHWPVIIDRLSSGNIVVRQGEASVIIEHGSVYDVSRFLGSWVRIENLSAQDVNSQNSPTPAP